MKVSLFALLVMLSLMAWLDVYSFQATKALLKNHNVKRYQVVRSFFWGQAPCLNGHHSLFVVQSAWDHDLYVLACYRVHGIFQQAGRRIIRFC